jgi:hypothetical protein
MAKVTITDDNIWVYGHAVGKVSSYRVTSGAPGERPKVLIETYGEPEIVLEKADVTIVREQGPALQELQRIATAFAGLSAVDLEQKALDAQEWGSEGSLTSGILKAIQEQIFGAQPDISTESSGTASAG